MSGAKSAGTQWMVLLEAADEHAGAVIDAAGFRRMVTVWGAPPPSGLYSPSRYALQVTVTADGPPMALAAAMALWSAALRRAGLPEWPLVRCEVVTRDEFESDFLIADSASADDLPPFASLPAEGDPTSDDLLRQALHDPVTGLPGVELFLHHVRATLHCRVPGSAVQAVMVAEVDGVEQPANEEVLVELAGRLKDATRRGDVVALAGGTRFALMVTVPPGEDIHRVARRVVDNVRSPILDEGPPLTVTASVGVAQATFGSDADDLIGMAEVAMAAAKDAGGDRHRQFATRPGGV
ncbi:MAG: GGDEF domain-containing protein [Actinomycetota bacterium]|nr:GGDEF domain-containing protein [Actinomycetota bacterium]